MNKGRTICSATAILTLVLVYPPVVATAQVERCDGNKPTIIGTSGPDEIRGTSGDDVILGRDGRDVIKGLKGDDIICGGAGNDTLKGGTDADALMGEAGNDSLKGQEGNDYLWGASGDDSIEGGNTELIFGRRFEDSDYVTYREAPGPVEVNLATREASGGDGNDTLEGIERVSASAFDDVLEGNDEANVLYGREGNDVISGGGEDDYLIGEEGDDVVDGGAGRDRYYFQFSAAPITADLAAGVYEGEGNDQLTDISDLVGSDFADTITGDDGENNIHAGQGDDDVVGLGSRDDIDGGGGLDHLSGGGGNDYMYGGSGGGTLDGAEGNDRMYGGTGEDSLTGGAGNDKLSGARGADEVIGGPGNDDVDGGGGLDHVTADEGNDWVHAGGAGEPIDGGIGNDMAVFEYSREPVKVDIGAAEVTIAGETRPLISIEGAMGSRHDDVLIGDDGPNDLYGWLGHDRITGGAGSDLLEGTGGDDVIKAGDGVDLLAYVFRVVPGMAINLEKGTARLKCGSHCTGLGRDVDAMSGVEGVLGTGGDDTLVGDDSDNIFFPGCGSDTIRGGEGKDVISFIRSTKPITANLSTGRSTDGTKSCVYSALGSAEGSDRFSEVEALIGSRFDDRLIGDAGANALFGNVGEDTLRGGGGDDYFDGGSGDDTLEGEGGDFDLVSFSDEEEAIAADLLAGTATGEGSDRLDGIEGILGGPLADHLIGSDESDVLLGSFGDDLLEGGLGNDNLDGGDGNDSLVGGDGQDDCFAGETLDSCEGSGPPPLHPHLEAALLAQRANELLGRVDALKRNNM